MYKTFVPAIIGAIMCTTIESREVTNMTYSDPYFTGRKDEIHKIEDRLAKHKTLQLNGISGIGKSSLAAEFVKLHTKNYDVVWWINGRNDILSQCSKFLKEVIAQGEYEVPDAVLKASDDGMLSYVFKLFKDKKVLIVIDDIQKLQGSLSRIINNYNRSGKVDILITTQRAIPNIEHIVLSSFPLKESQELIKKFYPRGGEEANDLASKLWNFPLALRQALEHMNFYGVSMKVYLQYLSENPTNVFSQQNKFMKENRKLLSMWDPKHDSADQVIRIYLQAMLKKDKDIEAIVGVLPFLSQQNVSKEFLLGYLKYLGYKPIRSKEIIGKLAAAGILVPHSAKDNSYHYHEIIKYIIPNEKTKKVFAKKIGEYLLSIMREKREQTFRPDKNGGREYIDHTQGYLDMCEHLNIASTEEAQLRVLMIPYKFEVSRDMDYCFKQVDIIDGNFDKINLPKYYKAMYFASKMLLASFNASDKPKMTSAYNDFIKNWNFIKGSADFKNIRLNIVSMAICHLLMNQNTKEAEKYVKYGDSIFNDIDDPWQKICFAYDKCWYLTCLGKYKEIDKLTDEIQPLFKNVSIGVKNFQHSMIKAEALSELGKIEAAEKYAKIALKDMQTYFGDRETDIKAEAIFILAKIHSKRENYTEALVKFRHSLELYNLVYNGEGKTIDQVETKIGLASCLYKMNQHEEALEVVEQAFGELKKLVGESADTKIIRRTYKLIVNIAYANRDYSLSGKYMDIYREKFGESIFPDKERIDADIEERMKIEGCLPIAKN